MLFRSDSGAYEQCLDRIKHRGCRKPGPPKFRDFAYGYWTPFLDFINSLRDTRPTSVANGLTGNAMFAVGVAQLCIHLDGLRAGQQVG